MPPTPPTPDTRPDPELEPPPDLTPDFWNNRYHTGETGWDLGEPSPPFVALHEQGVIAPCAVAVPGCGNGWEVLWLAARGYTVTGIDFAPEAVRRLGAKARDQGLCPELVLADVLDPPKGLHQRFDLILEQTCYCAIDPADRPRYVAAMHRMLRPDGRLVALFYACKGAGGPPFSTDPTTVRAAFADHFDLISLERTAHSHERRQGEEWLGILQRRPGAMPDAAA